MGIDTPEGRLREARKAAGYADASDFAAALGMSAITYRAYETGQNGYARHAVRFAAKLGTSAEWLLEGKGQEPGRRTASDFNAARAVIETVLELSGMGQAKRAAAAEVAVRALAILEARPEPGADPAQQARHTVLALWH
jgi:transcriptional regulator with XRE-family HTH domain